MEKGGWERKAILVTGLLRKSFKHSGKMITRDQVRQTPIKRSQYLDASPMTNLTVKMTNQSKLNPVSGKPVAYKFIPSASQLLLAHPDSIMAKRAQFATHHIWVTKYRDGELWAGGEFTNQSQKEVDGVSDAVARNEDTENEDIVVWNVFGLTVSSLILPLYEI